MGSIVNLNVAYKKEGISLANKLLLSSKQGFVFTSISQTLNPLSIIKSKPKI